MSTALFVLNPRKIPACIAAIQALDIPTCWISYMTEPQAAKAINQQIRATDYDRYVIVSDDTIPTQDVLDLILKTADQGHPVVTGYCNLDEDANRLIVNLAQNTLPPPPPEPGSYQFLPRHYVEAPGRSVIPTSFAGLALTLATRTILEQHPLTVSAYGGQMDYMLSYNLQQAGVPIVAPNGAYVHHVKERWNHADQNPDKRLLVGIHEPTVTWTKVKETTPT